MSTHSLRSLYVANKKIIWLVMITVAIAAVVYFAVRANSGPGPYDQFAQCLGDKGAVFYGTFWCPYCQNQKEMFGRSDRYLPYVECSTPNGRGQTQVCQEKGIEGYPTWEFTDGSRLSGVVPFLTLAEKTGCELP